MIKKILTFQNHDNETVTYEYHFHLSKAELAEMQLSETDGLGDHLRKILATGDGGLIMSTFKGLMLQTVGKRSEDGKLFRKTQDIVDEFQFSGAYGAMLLELLEDPNAGINFIKGILPADIVEKADLSDIEKKAGELVMKTAEPEVKFDTGTFQQDLAALLAQGKTSKAEQLGAAERMATMMQDPRYVQNDFVKSEVPDAFRAPKLAKPVSEMSVEEMRAALEGRQQL